MEKNKEKLYTIIIASVLFVLCILASILLPKLVREKEVEVLPTPTLLPTNEPLAVITAVPVVPTYTPMAYVPTALVVDGERVGVLASYQAAESCVEEITKYYEEQLLLDSYDSIETSILNEITFEEDAQAKGIVTADALAALLVSSDSPVNIKVQSIVTNTVLTSIKCTYEIIKDKYLIEGTQVVESVGADGQKQTVETVVYENGVKKDSEQTVEEILVQPQNGVIRKGTMEKDKYASPSKEEGKMGKDAGELSFISPVSGSIECNYGQLNGILHLGLDYNAKAGSEVKASCGGKVVSVLERGGYGLTVEIDHGNGFLTRYALLESASVNVGDTVSQGDTIGSVGNEKTLHFEIRIDGEAYNPRYYLD